MRKNTAKTLELPDLAGGVVVQFPRKTADPFIQAYAEEVGVGASSKRIQAIYDNRSHPQVRSLEELGLSRGRYGANVAAILTEGVEGPTFAVVCDNDRPYMYAILDKTGDVVWEIRPSEAA